MSPSNPALRNLAKEISNYINLSHLSRSSPPRKNPEREIPATYKDISISLQNVNCVVVNSVVC
jgi:hypothetical protein